MTQKINEKNLRRYLQNQFNENEDLYVKKFEEGQSNPTFYLKFGQRELVLRKKPPGKLLPGAHQVSREYRVMKALHTKGFPVPRVFFHCTDTDIIGTEFFIMEFRKGQVNLDDTSSKTVIKECILSAVETLAKLHSISPEEIGLQDYGRPTKFCERLLNTWWRQYKASENRNIPEMEKLAAWLKNNLPPEANRPSIIHGDYSLANIMFNTTENRVECLLDWELSTLGHPLTDLAYFSLLFLVPLPLQQLMYHKDFTGVLPPVEEVIAYYCKIRGINYPPPNWSFFQALSCFKLAAICQGVYARHLSGNASSTMAGEIQYVIEPLASVGLQAIASSEKSLKTMSTPVTLSPSPKGQEVLDKVKKFIQEHIIPNEKAYYEYLEKAEKKFCIVPLMEELKARAKKQGLWNLFLPDISGLSNVDYAHIAEQLGKYGFASEVFNCSPPDTGNMEVIHMYGNEYQKKKWLQPMLEGKIRSAFCMTEPDVASSDATNMELSIVRDGDYFIVNGKKWWSSGAGHPNCKFGIVMGKSMRHGVTSRHQQHSMIIVPFDTPGVRIVRDLKVFGFSEPPAGHMEVHFNRVRVPKENLILGEGRGFEIAQGRLGPGRIHHCMRSIGISERCLELFTSRAVQRKPFGKRILEHQVNQHKLAKSRIALDQARLLVLYTAHMIDIHGAKAARKEIAMIKVAAIKVCKKIIDRTIQVHGGAGVSQDFPLTSWYAAARSLQIADGPDEVHLSMIAKMETGEQLKKLKAKL